MIPAFSDRAFAPIVPPPGVTFKIKPYSWRDIGGPLQARIEATGDEASLWGLMGWLRYGVEIIDDAGEAVWWGYVQAVRIEVGALTISYSLANMVNRVRVAYQQRNADGTVSRSITTDADNALSQAYFGAVKERTIRAGDLSDAAAVAQRNEALAMFAYFGAELEVSSRGGAAARVTLDCAGWWQTLGWRMVGEPVQDQAQTTLNQYGPYGIEVTYYPFGFTNGSKGDTWERLGHYSTADYQYQLAQSFVLPTTSTSQPVYIDNVQAMLQRTGAGSAQLTLAIHADSGGADPGTQIGVLATLPVTDVGTGDTDWVAFRPVDDSPIWLMPGVRYWAVLTISPEPALSDSIMWTGVHAGNGSAAERARIKHNAASAWTDGANLGTGGDFNLRVACSHAETRLQVAATSAQTKVGQEFVVDTGSVVPIASGVRLRAMRSGSPADSLVVALYSSVAGAPGVLLDSVSIPVMELSRAFDWVTVQFGGGASLALGTPYWIVLSRSGAVDPNNMVIVAATRNATYPDGLAATYNGSSWATITPDTQLIFELLTAVQTSTQVGQIITGYAPLLGPARIDAQSGLFAASARDGDADALRETNALLEAGSVNNRRMLATVLRDRSVIVSEAPAPAAAWYLQRDGQLVDALGLPARMQRCPVGIWIAPRDVSPAGASYAPLGEATAYYVEESEFDPSNGSWRPRLRGQRDPFDLGGVAL